MRNRFYYLHGPRKIGALLTTDKEADEHIAKLLYHLAHKIISGTIHFGLFERIVGDYVSFDKFAPEIVHSIRPFLKFFAFWREEKPERMFDDAVKIVVWYVQDRLKAC